MKKISGIIGVDEVGRGALSGPVVVAAVFLPIKAKNREIVVLKRLAKTRIRKKFQLRDSKKHTPGDREAIFALMRQLKIVYRVARVSPGLIDRINIARAANLAALRAVSGLIEKNKIANAKILMDGGLFLSNSFYNKKTDYFSATTIIKGDEKFDIIKLASIVAKVHRDKLMVRLHRNYPLYELNKHKGYGTKKHIKAIKVNGFSPLHRLTYIKKYVSI